MELPLSRSGRWHSQILICTCISRVVHAVRIEACHLHCESECELQAVQINTAAQIVDKYRDHRDARQRRLRLIFISREWIGMVPLRYPLIYAVHNSSVARTASVQYREASGRVCNLSVRRYTVSSVPFTPIEANANILLLRKTLSCDHVFSCTLAHQAIGKTEAWSSKSEITIYIPISKWLRVHSSHAHAIPHGEFITTSIVV